MRRTAVWGAVLTFTVAGVAHADDTTTKGGSAAGSSGEWGGLYNGRTLGSGGGGVFVRGGWPDVGAGVLFGVVNGVDLGVSVAGSYDPNGSETDLVTTAFGLDLRAIARFKLVEGDTVSALLRVEPGFFFSSLDPAVTGGPIVDVALDVGIKVMTGGSIYLGLEIPTIFYTVNLPNVFVSLPILPGAGFEYHVNDFIAVGGRFNGGPAIDINTGPGPGTQVNFAMIAQGFFMFRWDRVK
jgi:hypothetical protein